jgi:hypothetical protein
VKTLNEAYSSLSTRRRYEVWFLRLGLTDARGAWWFRYLLMNPGRSGCPGDPQGLPVQVWATWFPPHAEPQRIVEGFPLDDFDLSARKETPFHFRVGKNGIGDHSCRGALAAHGHSVSWDLRYRSTFRVTLSDKGWIGFSRTPHSDAAFSGQITLDGRTFEGDPLGFGLQGHNCGYRHRTFWRWMHAYFLRPNGQPSTLEALVYDMPMGLVFRKAVLWHEGKPRVFRDLKEVRQDRENFHWHFLCFARNGPQLKVAVEGADPSTHRLSYLKTNCAGTFEVVNNSLALAEVCIDRPGGSVERLETSTGAVLEMAGR